MVGNRVQQKLLTNTFRSFHRSAIFRESKSAETSSSVSKNVERKEKAEQVILAGSKGIPESPLGPIMYTTNTLDKWLLVWHKEYKSIHDVPQRIRQETMAHIHSKSRIRVANIMMVLSLLGCVWAVWSGKKAAASGDTIQKRIMDKNKKLREDYLAELEKQKST